jgi:hypothetical protein
LEYGALEPAMPPREIEMQELRAKAVALDAEKIKVAAQLADLEKPQQEVVDEAVSSAEEDVEMVEVAVAAQ